jgi:phage-related protein (TIGR01555 family)
VSEGTLAHVTRASATSPSATSSRRRAGRSIKVEPAAKRAIAAERKERAAWSKARVLKELGKYENAAKAIRRGDDWQNVLTGLGIGNRDWRTATTLEDDDILTRGQLDTLYAQDNLAAKIVDDLAEDALRSGWRILGGDGKEAGDFQKKIFAELKRLKVRQRFLQWMKIGRKDGGCVILIGADDGLTLEEPLDPQRVREIRHLHCLERWTIIPDVIDLDPYSENFGEPLYYRLYPRALQVSMELPQEDMLRQSGMISGARIHHSRLFVHNGIQISERRKIAQRGWGYSVLQRAYNSIMNYRVLWAHIATLFKHVAQTVVKFAGYQELNAGDFQNAIQQRLAQIQIQRSTLNLIALDAEDKIEEESLRGLSGALEVLKYAQEDLAQASDMPLTKLFGHKPMGFSSDDESGRDNWQDRVRGEQEDRILEPLEELVELIAEAGAIATPDEWHIEFNPLASLDEKQLADASLSRAQRDKINYECGFVSPDEVRETLRADPRCEYIMEPGGAPKPPVLKQAPPGGAGEPK